MDCPLAEYLTIDEGLYIQIMRHGACDEEPATVAGVDGHITANGYGNDLSATRLHHEIYLSDPGKTEVSR